VPQAPKLALKGMDRTGDEVDDSLRLLRIELIELQHHRAPFTHGNGNRCRILKAAAAHHFQLLKPVGRIKVHAVSMTGLGLMSRGAS